MQYGALKMKRVTGTDSIGTGVLVQSVLVTHKSDARAICHIKESTAAGVTNIRIPFDVTGETTPALKPVLRHEAAVFLDNVGLPCPKKTFVVVSGQSTVGYVYYRTL